MQEDGINAIMKARQRISQVYKCKEIRSKIKLNANTREFVSRFEPLLYIPAFTTMKDFHYIHKGNFYTGTLHPRDYNLVYTRSEYPTLTILSSIQEEPQLKRLQVTW